MTTARSGRFRQLAQQLEARGYELTDLPPGAGATAFEVSASVRHAVQRDGFGRLELAVPVTLQIELDAAGCITRLSGGRPGAEAIAGATEALDDLIAAQQIDDPEQTPRRPRATHGVVRRADGRRVLQRRRFDGPG